ncbi:MAG TPA: hypothetical protein VEI24_01970 [Nitrospiria bacterium]|nr:hypothetical protein [Nitrospiria bacterium]
MLIPPFRRGAARRPAPWGLLIDLTLLPRLTHAAADSDKAINIRVCQTVHHSVVNITAVVVDYDLFFTPYSGPSFAGAP